MRRLLTATPVITDAEIAYVADAVQCVGERWDTYLKRFESALADYLGVRHVLLTSSCTGAMHIALLALGVGPGDEVVVPEISWVASGDMVLHVGATPVFADVSLRTWCMDAESAASLVTERTKAILPVHLYGHPAPMGSIMALARRHGLLVLEDAAPAIGAWHDGRRAGTFGEFGAFSFQGAKLLATGQGGCLVTNDDALYDAALTISDHGCPPGDDGFRIERLGVNYAMSSVQAALGLGQLEHIDAMLDKKRRLYEWYTAGLMDVPDIEMVKDPPSGRSACWMTCALLSASARVSRDDLRVMLSERGIDTRVAFPAMSRFPIWGRERPVQPNADVIEKRGLNLPTALTLEREDVVYVCRTLKEILG